MEGVLDFALREVDSQSATRLLRLPSSQRTLDCVLCIASQQGAFSVPFAQSALAVRRDASHQEKPAHALCQVIPRCCYTPLHGLVFEKLSLHDMMRFPRWLRRAILSELSDTESVSSLWTSRLPPGLQQLIKSRCQTPSLQPLPRGWLYLYKEKKLWREFQVNENGDLLEVDLSQAAGRDSRKPTALPTRLLALPIRINQRPVDIEIAFSRVQWSWARVCFWGGFSKNDPRYQAEQALPVDHASEAQRRLRFQRLASTASHEPYLLINDPLTLVERAIHDLQYLWQQHLEQIGHIGQQRYFDSALLAYQLFFSPSVKPNEEVESLYQVSLTPTFQSAPSFKQSVTAGLAEAAESLSRASIENTLGVANRRQLRYLICRLQACLLDFLTGALTPSEVDLVKINQQATLIPILADLFSASAVNYSLGYYFMSECLAVLSEDPSVLDHNLDLMLEQRDQDTSGLKFLRQLLNPEGDWYRFLFPSPQGSPFMHDQRQDRGDGSFRPDLFRQVFQASANAMNFIHAGVHHSNQESFDRQDYQILISEVPNLLDQSIAGILSAIRKASRRLTKEVKHTPGLGVTNSSPESPAVTSAWQVTQQLLQATGLFNQLQVTAWGDIHDKNHQWLVPGLMAISLPKPVLLTPVKANAIPIVDASHHVIGSASIAETKGVAVQYNQSSWQPTKRLPVVFALPHAMPKLPQLTEERQWFIHLEKTLLRGKKSLSVLMFILASYNVEQLMTHYLFGQGSETWRGRIEDLGLVIGLLASLGDITELLFGSAVTEHFISRYAVGNYWWGEQVVFSGIASTRLQHATLMFSFWGIYFSLLDLSQDLRDRDFAQSTAKGSALLGEIILVGSQMGQALRQRMQ